MSARAGEKPGMADLTAGGTAARAASPSPTASGAGPEDAAESGRSPADPDDLRPNMLHPSQGA
jgi:hypothetical protein